MGAAATQAEVRHQVTPARLTSPSTQDSQLCRCGAIPWSVCHPGTEGRCPPSSPTPASDPRHEHGQDVLRPGHTSEPVWEGGSLGLGPGGSQGCALTQQSCFPRLGSAQKQNRPPKAAAWRCASAPWVGRSGPGREAPDGERPGPSTQGPRCPHGGRTCEVSVQGQTLACAWGLHSAVVRAGVRRWAAGAAVCWAQQGSPGAACSRLQRCWAHPDAAVTTG